MSQDQNLVFLLLLLALMLLISYLLHFGFDKLRIPRLLAPLVIGFIFQFVPFPAPFISVISGEAFRFLAQLGIVFLLFIVGLELDINELRRLSTHIAVLAVLNLVFSSILGFCILVSFGYPPLVSAIVSTALATIAETTIAPVLDELGVIKTKVAELILFSGVVDDVAEVMAASSASVIVGTTIDAIDPVFLIFGFTVFVASALFFHKLFLPCIFRFDRKVEDAQLFLLMVSTILIFTAISQAFKLGVLLGAVVAGLIFQKFIKPSASPNVKMKSSALLKAAAYGFLGPVFFFGIGLSVDFSSFVGCFQLTFWLLVANFIGKFLGALIIGKIIKLNYKEVIIMGLGLSAKFSMGIIPVQIFYSAGIIDKQLFSAFIAVSAITTMFIPFTLAYIINRWRESITK